MRYTKIREFFDIGFEEIEADVWLPRTVKFYIHKKDILDGGKYAKFADYTRDRFEREFGVMLSFR